VTGNGIGEEKTVLDLEGHRVYGGFLDVFDGITMACSSMFRMAPSFNPEGIASFSPGVARFREGLPWEHGVSFFQPHRGCGPMVVQYANRHNPVGVVSVLILLPRVARSSQPWAKSLNPVGIGKTNNAPQISLAIPPKTLRNLILISED
jgi:hypothetical protein